MKSIDMLTKLKDYARSLGLDAFESIEAESFAITVPSPLPIQVRFKARAKNSLPDAFLKIEEFLGSLTDRTRDVFVMSAHNMDEVYSVDKIRPDHECEALGNSQLLPGGSGANTAYLLARIGLRVAVTGAIGKDANGDLLRSHLSQASVDVDQLSVLPGSTGRTLILVDRDARRFILVISGANDEFAANVKEKDLIAAARSSRVLHLSSLVGEKGFKLQEKLIQEVSGHTLISLTPGAIYSRRGLDGLRELLRGVHLLFLYREQLVELVQNSSAEIKDPYSADTKGLLHAVYAWRKRHDFTSQQIIVVKEPIAARGERWLSVGVGTNSLEQYVLPVLFTSKQAQNIRDTTGAGDAVAAGFIFALLDGAELNECIDKAFVFGSFASTAIGARTAFSSAIPGQNSLNETP